LFLSPGSAGVPDRSLNEVESGEISGTVEDTRRSPPIDGGRKGQLAKGFRKAKSNTSSGILHPSGSPRRRFVAL
jgi:hypothetical protein